MELFDGDGSSNKTKTKRVRTTFADEQISVLQAHFQLDSNPDGADLEKIANMTGLSKRVTQVWFQVCKYFFLKNIHSFKTSVYCNILFII